MDNHQIARRSKGERKLRNSLYASDVGSKGREQTRCVLSRCPGTLECKKKQDLGLILRARNKQAVLSDCPHLLFPSSISPRSCRLSIGPVSGLESGAKIKSEICGASLKHGVASLPCLSTQIGCIISNLHTLTAKSG